VNNVALWPPLPISLELEHVDFKRCKTPSVSFTLSCLGKTGILWDDIWKIGTGRTEHNFKLGDQRLNVSLADKTSIRSLGRKHTKN
jgi:hypothetical protein